MSYRIIQPSSVLAPYVHFYWYLDSTIEEGEIHMQRIIPTGLPEWTFYFDDQPTYQLKQRKWNSYSMISGQHYGFYDIQVSGHLQLFSVVFKPFAASSLLNMPISELRDLTIPASNCVIDAGDVAESLYEMDAISGKIKYIENYLLSILKRLQPSGIDRLASVFDLINQHMAQVTVDQMASLACYSRKQFERIFTGVVGISPKRYLRILRFQAALHLRSMSSKYSLTNLAMDSGYFDQAHMINDFKAFAGTTPKKFFQDCSTQSDYFYTGRS